MSREFSNINSKANSGADQCCGSVPIAETLIRDTLIPYSAKGCRYLQFASYEVKNPDCCLGATDEDLRADKKAHSQSVPLLRARANFSIATSSYIQDTGHFNAVEFVIAYNQLFYCALAQAIENRDIPELANWTSEEFRSEQLPSILIQEQSSRFFAPINARDFFGEIQISKANLIERRHRYVRLETQVSFWDTTREAPSEKGRKRGGYAAGHVAIAILLKD